MNIVSAGSLFSISFLVPAAFFALPVPDTQVFDSAFGKVCFCMVNPGNITKFQKIAGRGVNVNQVVFGVDGINCAVKHQPCRPFHPNSAHPVFLGKCGCSVGSQDNFISLFKPADRFYRNNPRRIKQVVT